MKLISTYCTAALLAIAATVHAAPPGQQPSSQAAPIRLAVALEPSEMDANSSKKAITMELALGKLMAKPVRIESGTLRAIAAATRSGDLDALWVPSNLAASALKSPGYEIYGFDGRKLKYAVLVNPQIKSFADMKGRSIYLPQEDSAASTVGVALLSDNDVRLSDFNTVYASTQGNYEIASMAVEKAFAKVSAMPLDRAQAEVAKSTTGMRILAVSSEVPGQTLVVKKTLPENERKELASYFAALAGIPTLVAMKPDDMKYVTGLTHYTPEEVPGVKKVGAKEVQDLIKAGVEVYDVRSRAEYDAKHLPGAKFLPYQELSARFVGADLTNDPFDLGSIAAKKIIVYCNGPECWKSFKAAQKAIASKRFEAVYWFRGGMPEWERVNLAVARSQ